MTRVCSSRDNKKKIVRNNGCVLYYCVRIREIPVLFKSVWNIFSTLVVRWEKIFHADELNRGIQLNLFVRFRVVLEYEKSRMVKRAQKSRMVKNRLHLLTKKKKGYVVCVVIQLCFKINCRTGIAL